MAYVLVDKLFSHLQMKQIAAFVSNIFLPSRFDSSTEQGRSRERERRIMLSSMAAILAKFLSAAVGLMTVPITLKYLGSERYGLWMTISSIVAMLGFADLGMGNGLLNVVARAHGGGDTKAIKRSFASAGIFLSCIACAILAVFALIYPAAPWADWLNVRTSLAVSESGQAVGAFVVCFAFNIPANLVQRLQLGLQMGFVANLWQMVGSIFAFIAVLVAVHYEAGLPWLVFALSGAPVLAALLNGIIFFLVVRPDLIPKLSDASWDDAARVGKTGVLFVFLQLIAAAAFASDNFIIGRILGMGAVSQYAVIAKMFSVIPLILSTLLTPLWPAYGEALARNDTDWAVRVLKKSLKMALLGTLALSSFLVLFGNQIMEAWVGKTITPSLAILSSFAIWKILEAVGSTFAVFLNGANIIRTQLILGFVTACSAVALKIFLTREIGFIGVIFGTSISYAVFSITPYCFLFWRFIRVGKIKF
ncbi:oligosaccharide flippase family protein [Paraburkholderia sp. SIMBA_030]|uniref:oligosaccharide flippase family protein n=1 Tax=Paraburkholderia sp. SIMBA_030 TaxID=3085773 RepID=UPI00397AF43E